MGKEDKMQDKPRRLILASGSPRRRELLEQIGIEFTVLKTDAEEVITKEEPGEIVQELSVQKALAAAAQVTEGLILGADTIVCLGQEVMEKPGNRQQAVEMLTRLQGRSHSVYTGVTLLDKKKSGAYTSRSLYRETKVWVHEMTEEEILRYVETGDADDKAGAYGIQGPFAAYIDGIEGDYYNVVGLPISAVYQLLSVKAVPDNQR